MEAQKRAMAKRSEGMPAVLKEFESGIRALIKENPDHPELWGALFTVAQYGDKESAKRVLADIIDSKADEDLISRAKGMLKSIGAVGQPLEISFTAADGKKVDIQKMKGKVVMVDFWASWCGPCMASLPEVIELYHKYHDKGFEIVGINLDKSKKAMDSVLEKYNIPWAQYFDGQGWGNKFSLEYGVSAIPSVWLVDKKGVLRTTEGREDMEKQIQGFLAEKD
jgi:thiol-disulfide isomerase/thioredoxin